MISLAFFIAIASALPSGKWKTRTHVIGLETVPISVYMRT